VVNDNDDEACADSGATDTMLPDYDAFVSYRRLTGRHVTLGDDSELPIAGIGSAKFAVNGKVLLLRHVLHVPGLRNPLYSLRKNKSMPGCGTFSYQGVGSFILFPGFTLRIDDSVDNIISYRSIGRQDSHDIAYAQPRASRMSSSPALIPDEGSVATPLSPDSSPGPQLPPTPATVSERSFCPPQKAPCPPHYSVAFTMIQLTFPRCARATLAQPARTARSLTLSNFTRSLVAADSGTNST